MRFSVIVGLLLITSVARAQYLFQSNASGGNWANAGTWSCLGALDGGDCTGAPTVPGNLDAAVIIVNPGSFVNINRNQSITVKDVFIVNDVANALRVGSGISGNASLTINGNLQGVLSDLSDVAQPTTTVIQNTNANLLITITGSNLDDPSGPTITNWGTAAPIRRLTFNPGVGNSINTDQFAIAGSGILTFSSGTTTLNSGQTIQDPAGTGSIVINSGAVFALNGGVQGSASTASQFNTLSSSGTVTVNTGGYLNSNNLTLNTGAVLNVFSSGANQTQGWWFQGNSPSGAINLTNGNVVFGANASQNIFPFDYGSLTLSGSGTISKTLTGSGTLGVSSTLTISSSSITLNTNSASAISIGGNVSNAGTWTPTDLVSFNGTGAQSIGGTSTISFNGGIDINKSAGTLSLNRAINIANGLTISQGTFNLGSQTVTLNSGNIDNDGTFTVGSSTFVVNGTTAITGTSPVSFNHLTIGASGNLTASGTVNIAGNLANTGTLNATTVAFNGTAAQNITGNGVLTNINISNTAGVTNNGTINLYGTLTLTGGGVFDTDGSGSGVFNIMSNDLTSNAGIAALATPSDLSGNITVQRFVNGPDDWRYFSIPVTGGNVGLWQDDFPVTGNFSNASPNGVDGVECSTCPSIFRFDAPTQAYVAIGTGGTTAATSLSSNIGYTAYTYLSGDFTIDMTGAPTKGNVNVALSASGAGFNLVPNPYPSPIDWDNINRTGTSGSMYMTTGQGSFATYLAGSGTCTGCSFNSGWRGEVAIGQSFWIESTGSTSLALTETAKTTSAATFVREDEESMNLFRVTLKSQGKEDDLIIHFNEEASYSTELNFDAKKRLNDYHVNLSSYNQSPEEHYAINGIPMATCDDGTVKLKMSNVAIGEHALTFTELERINLGYTITLIDNFLSTEKIIKNNDQYIFQTTADQASTTDGRFELRFTSPSIQTIASSSIQLTTNCGSNLLNIDILNSQQGVSYQIFKGDIAMSDVTNGNGQTLSTLILKTSLTSGLNEFNLKVNTLDGCQTSTFENIISYELVASPQIQSVTGDVICNEGSATVTAVGSVEAVAYRWYDSQLSDANFTQTITNSLLVDNVDDSRIYFVSAINKNGCESPTRTPVTIVVNKLITPEVTISGTMLSSSSATGNQWYKDGEVIEGATNSSYEVSQTGQYSVSVSINGCTVVSTEITVAITGLEDKSSKIVSVYPNPVNDWLTVEIPAEVASNIRALNLMDSKGATISSFDPAEISNGSLSINMIEKSKGFYYLDIRTADGVIVYRIIKN